MARETTGRAATSTEGTADAPNPAETASPAVDADAGSGSSVVDTGRATVRADRGGQTIGVEYGNPYDESAPPWPVYRDPSHDAIAAREKEDQRLAKLKADASGEEYRFTGHREPTEGTETLLTSVGKVHKGETIKLEDEEAAKIRSFGFKLTKV